MPRRLPNPGAQQMAFKGLPGDGARGRGGPLLPSLPLPQLRAVSGAGVPDSWRASGVGGGGGGWWPSGSSYPEMGAGVGSPSPRLPALPTVAQRAAQNRTKLRSLLLPPLLLARAPREPAPPRARPGESEDPWRGAPWEAPDSLRGLLGELLPSRFREFLHQWQAELMAISTSSWLASSASPPKRSVSEHCHNSPQCPHCSFLPDLRGQSSYFQDSLKKILLHQIPALGTLRKDRSQFTLKKGNHRSHNIQAPKLKTVLTHSSSGEGSGRCRRFCPFRVRFADETLRDTALRYWERNCAGRQTGWGVPGLQKVPAWSPENRGYGPGSKGRPAKARNPLTLPRRLLQRVSGGLQRPSSVQGPAEVSEYGWHQRAATVQEQWLPRLGYRCRTSCCQGFSGRGSALSLDFHGGVTGLPIMGKKAHLGLQQEGPEGTGEPQVAMETGFCPALPAREGGGESGGARAPPGRDLTGALSPPVQQSNIENGIATRSSTSERVSGSVGRWLESLPKALSPRAQEKAMASVSLFCWECPGLPTQEPQSHLSEDAFMNSLPFIPRASTQRQQGDLKTLLDTDHILEPVGKSRCSWSQKLVSTCWQPTTQSTPAQGVAGVPSEASLHVAKGWGLELSWVQIPSSILVGAGGFLHLFPHLYRGADSSARPFGLGESFLPSLVLHTVLKRGRPKGYRLLLPSTKSQQAPG
nr:uncharacterized protein C9orf50 homolog [Vulpes vulpes]